jgi:hypothetical protein
LRVVGRAAIASGCKPDALSGSRGSSPLLPILISTYSLISEWYSGLRRSMNSKEKGDMAVGCAIGYYTRNNIQVLIPIGDKKPYDLVIEKEGELKKVQCKYTGNKSKYGSYEAPLRVCGGNQSRHTTKSYKEGDFDFLFVLTAEGQMYEIPSKITNERKATVSVGPQYIQYLLS